MNDPKTTDYCAVCGESPDSGSHLLGHGHEYQFPVQAFEREARCFREALDYLRRKIDGYDETFSYAEFVAAGRPGGDSLEAWKAWEESREERT